MNLKERIKVRREMLTYHYLAIVLSQCGKKTTKKQRNSLIISNSYKFESLMIADMLDELGQIDGKPSSDVYSMYKYIANNAKIKIMTNINFSHFICCTFGYCTRVERNGKPVRVYRKINETACNWKNNDLVDNWNEMNDLQRIKLICAIDEQNPLFSIDEFNTHIKRLLEGWV